MKLFNINFQIKDEDDQPVSTKYYKDLLKESLKEDIERLLRIPIDMMTINKNEKSSQKVIDHEEKISTQEMTTNDMTRLNEKIVQNKSKIQELNINNDGKSSPTKTKKNTKHISNRIMIKSAS